MRVEERIEKKILKELQRKHGFIKKKSKGDIYFLDGRKLELNSVQKISKDWANELGQNFSDIENMVFSKTILI